MNLWLTIPFDVRLAVLFVLGACLGGLANLGIYRLAWHPRSIGPWTAPSAGASPRRWSDRLPLFGWLGLRREASLHGRGFWIRPLLIELLCGLGLAALYWWEIDRQALLPPEAPRLLDPAYQSILHAQFFAHALLILLMLVASVIDVDEKIIPDAITVPGVLAGLLLATCYPASLLPENWTLLAHKVWPGPEVWPYLQLTSPNLWPEGLDGFPRGWPLLIGLACWAPWCAALLPRTWYVRHGRRRALALCMARVMREKASYRILVMAVVGSLAIAAVWWYGKEPWAGLLTALVGMAAAGGLVWAVRIIGTAVLKREAMGFGDVTLMAMIGAFLGWQTSLVIFFLAPFAALVVGLVQVVLIRDSEIPYGPFLCLATVATVVYWAPIWDWSGRIFELGWFVPAVMVVCLALMALLLGAWQAIRGMFR